MRIIAHLDMDAFFASLEEAASPIFKGKPIAVGSDPKEGKGRANQVSSFMWQDKNLTFRNR